MSGKLWLATAVVIALGIVAYSAGFVFTGTEYSSLTIAP